MVQQDVGTWCENPEHCIVFTVDQQKHMRNIVEQTETDIQRLERQVEEVQTFLEQIGQQLQRIAEAIYLLHGKGDKEVAEALHPNLKEKQDAEQKSIQQVSLLTAELDDMQARVAEAQMQNQQSRTEVEALETIGEDVGNALTEVSDRDAILKFQEQQIRILKERLGAFGPTDTVRYEPRSLAPKSERIRWVDEGIQPVAVHMLQSPEGIQGAADFQKVSAEEMRAGIRKLQRMQPAIENGVGANSDYWASYDKNAGLQYSDGYQRIYDAFFGLDAIKVTFDGEKYDIINGRHRIWLAQRMGIDYLPMRVSRKVESPNA